MAKQKSDVGFITEKEIKNAKAEQVQQAKEEKNKPVKRTNSGKPGFFKRIGQKFKDVFSELKKVTWPKFPKTVKQTGVVLVVVIIFLVVITAFDFGLLQLLKLLQA